MLLAAAAAAAPAPCGKGSWWSGGSTFAAEEPAAVWAGPLKTSLRE